jgi:5-methylcytosine-specific restriction endonuclease McrA
MWNLDLPTMSTREAFRLCISSAISARKLTLLKSYEEDVVTAAQNFELACKAPSVHQLTPADFSPDQTHHEDKDDLIDMYERRMDAEHPGRPIYEEVRNRRTKCPLCGVGRVKQVDHHLPKSKFPFLSVAPINLVPICADCNFAKGEKYPRSYGQQTLHPYFDNIDDQRWLRARLVTISGSGQEYTAMPGDTPTSWYFSFYVSAPREWSAGLTERVRHHFAVFNLADLYEDQAADEVTSIELALGEAFEAGGSTDVRLWLESMARSRRRLRNNTWMVALYEGLAINDWYCDGGFRLIAAG